MSKEPRVASICMNYVDNIPGSSEEIKRGIFFLLVIDL
jgi:hypothetical protein